MGHSKTVDAMDSAFARHRQQRKRSITSHASLFQRNPKEFLNRFAMNKFTDIHERSRNSPNSKLHTVVAE